MATNQPNATQADESNAETNPETADDVPPEVAAAPSDDLEAPIDDLGRRADGAEWTNHWDASPKAHGGAFCRWDGDHWDVLVTTPPQHFPDGMSESEHCFEVINIYPDDVWRDGDPRKGFSDTFRDATGGRAYQPDHVTDMRYIKGAVWDIVRYFGAYHLGGHENWVPDGEYWDEVAAHGVPVDEFR